MNGKLAKRLREDAREIENFMNLYSPYRAYQEGKPPVYFNMNFSPLNPDMFVKVEKGTPTVLGKCTRKTIKLVKKEHKHVD